MAYADVVEGQDMEALTPAIQTWFDDTMKDIRRVGGRYVRQGRLVAQKKGMQELRKKRLQRAEPQHPEYAENETSSLMGTRRGGRSRSRSRPKDELRSGWTGQGSRRSMRCSKQQRNWRKREKSLTPASRGAAGAEALDTGTRAGGGSSSGPRKQEAKTSQSWKLCQ